MKASSCFITKNDFTPASIWFLLCGDSELLRELLLLAIRVPKSISLKAWYNDQREAAQAPLQQ